MKTYSQKIFDALQSTMEEIYGNISIEEILSDSRIQYIVLVRYIMIDLYLKATGASLVTTGKVFHKHHTSIIHARRVVASEKEFSKGFRHDYEMFEKLFNEKLCENSIGCTEQ